MKIESLKKDELVNYCKNLNIITVKKTKIELINAVYTYRRDKIDKAIASKTDTTLLKLEIQKIADEYAFKLNEKIINRKSEMKSDDTSHYMIYKILGISFDDGVLIDDGIGGEYYAGIKAWEYLKEVSGYDLKSILEEIAMGRDDG